MGSVPAAERHAVTGAFGFSGRYIAQLLLRDSADVLTLTNSPAKPDLLSAPVAVHPLCFDDPDRLARALEGATVLYNTYWVRFNYRIHSQDAALANTRILFEAAARAGVRRIVHTSITNPSGDSPYEYFRGKAELERLLADSGIPHSILRPSVIFGREDILINNIAWMLRKFPVFGIFGDGRYRVQPIFVEDFARLAVAEGSCVGNRVVNAVGPETLEYRELVSRIGEIIGCRRPMTPIPAGAGYAAGILLGKALGDVVLTREEIGALMQELLYVDAPPAGPTKLTDWARANASTLGRRYASELARRTRMRR